MKNEQEVLIANSDRDESSKLADMIRFEGHRIRVCHSMGDLQTVLAKSAFLAVILDIDNLDIDNRTIRNLTLAYPDVCFLCTSRERFHPELKEALCYYIFACINKPVDPEEMVYWIRCIRDNQTDSRDPPASEKKDEA